LTFSREAPRRRAISVWVRGAGPRALTRRPRLRQGVHLNWLAASETQAERLASMIAIS
jgi:hypothetical protein